MSIPLTNWSFGCYHCNLKNYFCGNTWGFPGAPVDENLSANAEDTGSIPYPGKSHMAQSN